MKATTTPGDCYKVNQIVPIMQEHLGSVINLAHYALNLDLIAKVIFALLPVKTGLVLSIDRTN